MVFKYQWPEREHRVATDLLRLIGTVANELLDGLVHEALIADGLVGPDCAVALFHFLEEPEEVRLLAACRGSRAPSLLPIVTTAMETGMRLGEVLGLTWEQIGLGRGVISLERTKSDRRREIPVRQAVYDLLAAVPEPREGRVWPVRSIRTAFERAVADAKLDRPFTFHDLRHHFASWFVMRGGRLEACGRSSGTRRSQ
jgi:integrase